MRKMKLRTRINKTRIVLTATLLIVSTIMISSCSRDENIEKPKPNAKSTSQLRDKLATFYAMCDSAYLEDPVTFMEVCEINDSSTFLSLTGITLEQINELNNLCKQELDSYTTNNPEIVNEEIATDVDILNSLSILGSSISFTAGSSDALVPAILTGENLHNLMKYEVQCSETSSCTHAFYVVSRMAVFLSSFEAIAMNYNIKFCMRDGDYNYISYNILGSEVSAIENSRFEQNNKYCIAYSDDTDIAINVLDDSTAQLSLGQGFNPFILNNMEQRGDSAYFDIIVNNVLLASCMLHVKGSNNLINILRENHSIKLAWGPVAVWVVKAIAAGAISYGVVKAADAIFSGNGNNDRQSCRESMERMMQICFAQPGRQRFTAHHVNCPKDCWCECVTM